MSTIHRGEGLGVKGQGDESGISNPESDLVAFVKGAPRETLALCTRIVMNGDEHPLSDEVREQIMSANDDYAGSGLRVLAVALRRLPASCKDYTPDTIERDLTFLGLMAMMDPPRPEVADAVEKCHCAGIRVIMITGDYGLTAESIARRIGIIGRGRPRILSGAELDAIDDNALKEALESEVIFARVAPEHKLRVVKTLQEMGHMVAVTGDGVNDAPALKKADIGIAMGIGGTEVAREAADMVLTDDNFASIVNAIEEGRAVYANIKKFVTYIFSHNMTEAWPFIVQILFNIPLALPVMQVLAIDLGTDILPALALGTEAPEPGTLECRPRDPEGAVDRWSVTSPGAALAWQYPDSTLLHGLLFSLPDIRLPRSVASAASGPAPLRRTLVDPRWLHIRPVYGDIPCRSYCHANRQCLCLSDPPNFGIHNRLLQQPSASHRDYG